METKLHRSKSIVLAATCVSLLIGSTVLGNAELSMSPNSPFDSYGAIRWEDEKARLDNFAIALQNYEKSVGCILVYDDVGGCPGEAKARAIRAKRYMTEYRGIPWNRVWWRRDGFTKGISHTLLVVPEGASVPYPYRDSVEGVDGPATPACRERLQRIRKSRW